MNVAEHQADTTKSQPYNVEGESCESQDAVRVVALLIMMILSSLVRLCSQILINLDRTDVALSGGLAIVSDFSARPHLTTL